ncbi:MAG: helix-turn-helix domain-containing protein [Verrucomicrobiota bacterium]
MEETENTGTSREKEFYSLEEVADLLGVSYQLIYKLVRSGELAAARLGKVYRVSRRDLDHYLEQSKSHAGGGTCVVCAKVYTSRLSLKESCPECGEPICVDCWMRKKVRGCRAHPHSDKNKDEAVTASSSGS